MAVGTTISIVLATEAKHSVFFAWTFKKWQNIGDGCTSGRADCKWDKPCNEGTGVIRQTLLLGMKNTENPDAVQVDGPNNMWQIDELPHRTKLR